MEHKLEGQDDFFRRLGWELSELMAVLDIFGTLSEEFMVRRPERFGLAFRNCFQR